jgi:hypothetical protein
MQPRRPNPSEPRVRPAPDPGHEPLWPEDDPLTGGGQERGPGPPPPRGRFDLTALFVLLDALRRVVPGELRNQFTALIRELLLTLRSLIDWYLERLERSEREPEVEDIPIE